MKWTYIIAFLVIVGALGFTMYAFSGSLTPYVTVSEAKSAHAPVQVRGRILKNTVHYDPQKGNLYFTIEDDQHQTMEIIYPHPKPDAFDSARDTAATGIYRNGLFHADNLIIKCPSKYNDRRLGSRSSS